MSDYGTNKHGSGGELKEPSNRQKVSMKFRETQHLEKVPASAFFLLKLPNSAFPLLKVTYYVDILRHMLNTLHIILGHFQQGRRYTMFNV